MPLTQQSRQAANKTKFHASLRGAFFIMTVLPLKARKSVVVLSQRCVCAAQVFLYGCVELSLPVGLGLFFPQNNFASEFHLSLFAFHRRVETTQVSNFNQIRVFSK
jgi:hypothetical protein